MRIIRQIIFLSVRGGRQFVQDPRSSFLMVRMAGWVCVLSLAVKLRPLPSALSLIATSSRLRPKTPTTLQARQLLADRLDQILQTNLFWLEPVCWKRAAVLHRYLALSGTSTEIVFGMRKDGDGTMSGHAWLESDGSPILETTLPDYTVTYRFPSNKQINMEFSGFNLTSH